MELVVARDQSTGSKRTWRAYVESMGNPVHGKPVTCRRPQLGHADLSIAARSQDPYLTWRNPFVYFASLTQGSACAKNDVGLDQLTKDLKAAESTPSLAYIVPSACDDGSEQPCRAKAAAGLPAADHFLQSVIPEIQKSPAYKDHGLIAITFDEAAQTGAHADHSACCNNPAYPNVITSTAGGSTSASSVAGGASTAVVSTTTSTQSTGTSSSTDTTTSTTSTPFAGGGQTTPTGGGGQVGLMLISKMVKPGTLDVIDYFNHFSLLGTMEELFGVKRLGYAGDTQLPVFDATVFNAMR